MNYIESSNNRNASQIEFVSDECADYKSIDDFYTTVILKLWQGWDSEENAKQYIRNSEKKKRTIEELNLEISACIKITPITEFNPDTRNATEIYSLYDDWNNKELLWKCDNKFWMMLWGTSA